MLDVIIINAFPNNEQKISLLTNQVENLKKLNLPILIISGCQIPRHIIEQIDYYIINTDNERLEKDFSYKINNMGVKGPVIEWVNYGDNGLYFHTTNVNCTIVSNIKKSFELAKSLGFKTALYTEDDNIFNERKKLNKKEINFFNKFTKFSTLQIRKIIFFKFGLFFL